MSDHFFAKVLRREAKPEAMAGAVTDEVVFKSPILLKPLSGRQIVLDVMGAASQILSSPTDVRVLRDRDRAVVLWRTEIDGNAIDAAATLTEDANGLIEVITVFMRPYPVVELFRDAMVERMGDAIPEDYLYLKPA